MNNPRNIVTPSAVSSKSTVSPFSTGTTGAVQDITSTKQPQHNGDDGPLIKKPKLTASCESLNSTMSSGQQVSVHSGSSDGWGQQESDSSLHARKSKLTISHESINSTASSGPQSSISASGGRWRQQERENHSHTKPSVTASHESLILTERSGKQANVHAGGNRLSEGASEKPSSKSGQLQQVTPAKDVAKVPVESGASVIPGVTTLANVPSQIPNAAVKLGSKVELRHEENQSSKLPFSRASSMKLEEGDASNIDELNDLDGITAAEERVPLSPRPIGVPLTAIHEHGDLKHKPMIDEHSEQQQLGDDPCSKVSLPSSIGKLCCMYN